jgi:hypothetical protein
MVACRVESEKISNILNLSRGKLDEFGRLARFKLDISLI